MINRYEYSDPLIKSNSKYPDLNVSINESYFLKIFRILSGTINCTDNFTEKTYRFRTNYFEFPCEQQDSLSHSSLTNMFPDEIDISALNVFFNQIRRNASFYKSIQVELVKCLIAKKKNDYLESFFYLYRIIEGICYTIPLLYTSKSNDFKRSYGQLKKFFSNNSSDGELAFFKRFISETYNNEDFFSSTVDVDFGCIEIEDLKTKYYDIYKRLAKDNNIEDFTEGEEIKFSFIGFYEFLIEVRNRFFHFLQGSWNENLSSTELLYPDLFFKPIVKNGINWIGIILFEIIKFDIDRE